MKAGCGVGTGRIEAGQEQKWSKTLNLTGGWQLEQLIESLAEKLSASSRQVKLEIVLQLEQFIESLTSKLSASSRHVQPEIVLHWFTAYTSPTRKQYPVGLFTLTKIKHRVYLAVIS